jgi:hypothetical protein
VEDLHVLVVDEGVGEHVVVVRGLTGCTTL